MTNYSLQINFLGLSSSALIKAKRLELKHKQKQQAKVSQADAGEEQEKVPSRAGYNDTTK